MYKFEKIRCWKSPNIPSKKVFQEFPLYSDYISVSILNEEYEVATNGQVLPILPDDLASIDPSVLRDLRANFLRDQNEKYELAMRNTYEDEGGMLSGVIMDTSDHYERDYTMDHDVGKLISKTTP